MTLTTQESKDDRTQANQAAVRTSKNDRDTDDVDQAVSTRSTCRGDLCFPPSSGSHPTDED